MMVNNDEIEQRLRSLAQVSWVKVEGDGYHYRLVIVSDIFEGQSAVLRQQWVYSHLHDYITQGAMHALTMKTWTNAEWEKQQHG